MQRMAYRDPASGTVIRTDEFYINRDSSGVLVRTVVVEERVQSFHILIETKGDELVFRLDPTAPVEKTGGVKKSIALLALRVMSAEGMKIARTNLQMYLEGLNRPEANSIASVGRTPT
jgi:hypothetical protein